MLNDNTEKAIRESEILFKRLDRTRKFGERYHVLPSKECVMIAEGMQGLSDSLPSQDLPQNQDQHLQAEIKRRLVGESALLRKGLSGKLYDFDTVLGIYGITHGDLNAVDTWLEQNKETTQESIERLFQSKEIDGYELPVSTDVPRIRRQVEEFAGVNIERYHKTIGGLLQKITKVGEFLRDFNAVPTKKARSYFHTLTNNLGISIEGICFEREDGTLHIREKELIRIYGHEGMGHALNFALTRSSGLPYFLTQTCPFTTATEEAVAQFYEKRLMEDLKNSPETQRKLGIEHKFDEIYQEIRDTEQIEDYKRKIGQYCIVILGDKSLGNPKDPAVLKKKIDMISRRAIDGVQVAAWVESRMNDFDSQGNLNPELVSELRYCAQPVYHALEDFKKRGVEYVKDGRNTIDEAFLRGFWTPQGFVNNARLIAEASK